MPLPERLPSIGLLVVALVALSGSARAQEPDLAFVGGTVIRMDGSPPLADATVLVRGDRIAAVGPRDSVAVGEGATVVDATGAWLIPGLWDMHVHALFDAELAGPLLKGLLAHGVTGIRDMGGPLEVLLEMRARIAAGELPGPRIVASVKVYTMLQREAFFAVVDAARERGLPVAGHVPGEVTPIEAAEAGMRSVEHMRSEIELFCTRADPSACDPVFAAFRERDVWQTPTLLVRRNRAFLDDSTTVYGPGVRRAPRMLRDMWGATRASRLERGPEYFEEARAHHREERWLAGELHRAGIGVLAGSDAGALFAVHGVSLHQELALLVEAGLEPQEALAAATSDAARFLGVDDSLGTIAPGKKADLVLLDADPLQDIAHTRRIRAVVRDGRMLDRAALDRLKDETAFDEAEADDAGTFVE